MQPLTSRVGTSSATLRITGPVTRSAAKSGSSTLPQTPSPLKRGSPTKDKGKKRKRDNEDDGGDEARKDRSDITAQILVQQVTSNTMSVIIRLTCPLSAGVGTSRTSRWDYHHPSLW